MASDRVYRAEETSTDGLREYLGQSNVTFKLRWNNHKNECKLPHKEKVTCLSKYIRKLKRQETNYTINWPTKCLASPYSRETKKCQLTVIGLNRRGEIMTRY